MSADVSHADTIRRYIKASPPQRARWEREALAALDALLAENQQLRDALEEIATFADNADFKAKIARAALAATTEAPHLMDRMGAWSDNGTAWFAREHYPTRADVRRFYISEFDPAIPYIELSVLARYARHAPDDPAAPEFDGEFWVQCQKDEPGAFPVWRVE
jgi:hypothetical protein